MQKHFPGSPDDPADNDPNIPSLEPWMRGAQFWAQSWQALPIGAAQFMTRRFYKNLQFGGRLLLCKDVRDVMQLQQEWLGELFADYTDEVSKITAATLGAAAANTSGAPPSPPPRTIPQAPPDPVAAKEAVSEKPKPDDPASPQAVSKIERRKTVKTSAPKASKPKPKKKKEKKSKKS